MLNTLLSILGRHTKIRPHLGHTLEGHLGLDPFAMLLIAAEVEEALGIELNYDALAQLETVAGFIALTERATPSAPPRSVRQSGLHAIDTAQTTEATPYSQRS